ATNTISLQEQLCNKDIPHLTSLYPQIKYAKAKGRNNYICLYKLNNPDTSLFAKDMTTENEAQIRDWLNTPAGESGDKSDITFELSQDDWQKVGADTLNCYGNTCPYYKDCYYNRAKAKTQSANIIITTHAMVLTDFIQGNGLPDYTHIILDEAHNFGKNAVSALTVDISRRRVYWLINQSKSKFCRSGFRQGKALKTLEEWQKSLKNFSDLFFQSLTDGRILAPQENKNGPNLVDCIRQILVIAEKSIERCDMAIAKTSLKNLCDEAFALAFDLETWLIQSNPDTVYWVEKKEAHFAPINIGANLVPFWKHKNTILTSATLCVAKEFNTIRHTLKLDKETSYACRLESPFNYKENGLIYVPPQAPSPKSERYTDYVIDTTVAALNKTGGKTFVLFTSYSMMSAVAEKLKAILPDKFTWLVQGTDTRERLLQRYRTNRNAVFLGTDTFWEGIDEDIDCVILTKLPFAVPTSPIEEAKYESIKAKGKNPFMLQALPQCAIKLKQGAGRLIRHHHKRGVIIICDPRIGQNWGQAIRKTLPDMKWTEDIAMMDSYLENRAG
ncbi:MAG: ATP-dependent DNA helicase, partial [Anaerotignum sp.]|nr:ATP-dependent DNA helicase [Anaerotignum sp.]